MLDVECSSRGTVESYVQKISVQHKQNSRLLPPEKSGSGPIPETRSFTVQHYAGKVVYDGSMFLGNFTENLLKNRFSKTPFLWTFQKRTKTPFRTIWSQLFTSIDVPLGLRLIFSRRNWRFWGQGEWNRVQGEFHSGSRQLRLVLKWRSRCPLLRKISILDWTTCWERWCMRSRILSGSLYCFRYEFQNFECWFLISLKGA